MNTIVTHDKNGKEYAKLSELKEGQTIYADQDFTCLSPSAHTIHSKDGYLYVNCNCGMHSLNDDEGDYLVGWYTEKP